MVKLDLINSRFSEPTLPRVYDSLEDLSMKKQQKTNEKTLVKMTPNNVPVRSNTRRELCKLLPARFENLKYDRKGNMIEVQQRVAKEKEKQREKENRRFSMTATTSSSISVHERSISPPSSVRNTVTDGSTASLSSSQYHHPPSILSQDGLLHTVFETGSIASLLTPKSLLSRAEEEISSDEEGEEQEEGTFTIEEHLTETEKRKIFRKKQFAKLQKLKEKMKEKEKEDHYHPTFDIIHDKLYKEDLSYTIENRIKSKKLPGASWSDVDRKLSENPYDNPLTGPGYYEVYNPTQKTSLAKDIVFDDVPRQPVLNIFATSDRIINNIDKINFKRDFLKDFPLREVSSTLLWNLSFSPSLLAFSQKLRITRQINEMKKKYPNLFLLKTSEEFKNYLSPSDYEILKHHIPEIRFAPEKLEAGKTENRFSGSALYKQEIYVKTTGLILSNDYDKKIVEHGKVPFRFDAGQASPTLSRLPTAAKAKEKKQAPPPSLLSLSVSVNANKHYETSTVVEKSPVRYSSAFK
jgi:hypothetical protein